MRVGSIVPWLWAVATVVVVSLTLGLLWWRVGPGTVGDPTTKPTGGGPSTVPCSRDYYVWVKLIELTPKMPNGSRWDMDGSAPDVRFRLWWKGNLVQESTTRRDSLIATWELLSADLLEIVRSGGTIEVASVVSLPIVRVEPGMTLRIVVDDNDVGNGEPAGELDIALDQLTEGENTLPGPGGGGLARAVVQLIDVRTPASELMRIAVVR